MAEVPSLLDNLQRFYDALAAESTPNGDGVLIFEGHVTRVFHVLNLPQPYYTKMRRWLIAMGCIQQTKRGARYSQSVWELRQRPTADLMNAVDPDSLVADRNAETTIKILQQRIADIQKQLGGLDVARAMADLQLEINELRTRIERLENGEGSNADVHS